MTYELALGKAATLAMTRTDNHVKGLDDVALVIRFEDGSGRKFARESVASEFFAVTNRERKVTGAGKLGRHTVWAVARLVSFVGVGGDSRAMLEVTQEAEGREMPQ